MKGVLHCSDKKAVDRRADFSTFQNASFGTLGMECSAQLTARKEPIIFAWNPDLNVSVMDVGSLRCPFPRESYESESVATE